MERRIAAPALRALFAAALLSAVVLLPPRQASAAVLKWRSIPKDIFVARCTQFTQDNSANKVLSLFVSAKKKQQKYFNKSFGKRVEIVMYPGTGDFTAATGEPWWHGAVWLGGRIHLQPPGTLEERGILSSTISHEFAHLALVDAAGQDVPLWFDEGFAAWSSGEFDAEFKSKPELFFWNGKVAGLEKALSQTKDKDLAGRAYRACYRMVRMMHEQYGAKNMLALYKETSASGNFDKALAKILKTSADKITGKIRGAKKGTKKKSK